MQRIGALMLLLFSATTGFAHYNMLLPDKAWANKGDEVTFTYQFGHPFEHELFDAPKPVELVVLRPKFPFKESLDIDKTLKKIELAGADGKKVVGWQFIYTPTERGDHVFMLKTAKIKIDEGQVEDLVKVVLHVQTQTNWDRADRPYDNGVDLIPYTRPYGLVPGMVFKGRVATFPLKKESDYTRDGHPDHKIRVEIEKYNPKPLKNMPADELITFGTKTDFNGFFVTTLPEAGWWGITALADHERLANAKGAPETRRATLWLHVDEKK